MSPIPVSAPCSVFRIVWIGSPQLFQPLAHLHSIIILKNQHDVRSFVVLNDSEPFPSPEAIRQLWQLSKEIADHYRINDYRINDYRTNDYRTNQPHTISSRTHSSRLSRYRSAQYHPPDSSSTEYPPAPYDDDHSEYVGHSTWRNNQKGYTPYPMAQQYASISMAEMVPLRLDHLSSNAMRTFAEKPPETLAFINPHADPSSSEFVATYTDSDELAIYRYVDWVRSSPRPELAGVVESTITYQPFR